MANVTINGKVYDAEPSERLSELLIRTGNAVPMPCGGRGDCGKCLVSVNGESVLACEYEVVSDVTVRLPERESIASDIGAATSGFEGGRLSLALDIGTTTLALALVSVDEKKVIRAVTRANPQRMFGADVMSRIARCMSHGPAEQHRAITDAVKEMLAELRSPAGLTLYAAGNATMLHLFLGEDPSSMGAAPFVPVFLEMRKISGAELGLDGVDRVVTLPSAAAFVGADLTAGLNYLGFPPEGRRRLLIDLGTNAEIILFSRGSALCTAAAAGPCFEGANISCGMSASPGAICAYDENGYRTIADAPAVGICGTGLVDIIACLLRRGVIDESGYMEEECFEVAPGVKLTQGDVRQFQLAKAAVRAATEALLSRTGDSLEDIDAVYISGGFSTKINIANAVSTGMLPPEINGKCVAVGNSSLLGTVKYACEGNDLSDFLKNMQYVDLAADPVFSDLFIERMAF